MAHFDNATTKWFREHPHNETTVMECDKCGLFYKPSLDHKCPKKIKKGGDTLDKQKEKLKQMLEEERKRNKGYEELAKLHGAYISILLHRLKATRENAVTISSEEVKRAMSRFKACAYTDGKSEWKLYCEELKE